MKKSDALLLAMGEIDGTLIEHADPDKGGEKKSGHGWVKWCAAAACVCLVWGAAFVARTAPPVDVSDLLPASGGNTPSALHIVQLSVGELAAEYHEVSAHGGRKRLADSLGEPLEGEKNFYRLAGHEDFQYLIHEEKSGSFTLWQFAYLQTSSVFTYPYGLVLEKIYGLHSADDLERITVSPATMDNTDAGAALQREIGSLTITEPEELSAIYEIISGLECLGSNNWGLVGLGNDTLEGVRLSRYLTIQTKSGLEIGNLKYTAISGSFYEYSGVAYSALEEAAAQNVERILGITK